MLKDTFYPDTSLYLVELTIKAFMLIHSLIYKPYSVKADSQGGQDMRVVEAILNIGNDVRKENL